MLPDILPDEVDKLLYLDVDIIVNKSVEELFLLDFGQNVICACKDGQEAPFRDNRDLIFREQISLGFTYFCSGVLLMDMKALRKKYCFQDYINLAEKLNFQMVAPDQDILNYMHWKETKIIDANRYNLFAKAAYNHDIHYDEVKQAVTIIHFAGQKPWAGEYVHYDIEQLWWDYARLTPFYEEFLEEFVESSVNSPLIYDAMTRLSAEKKQLKEELEKSVSLCRKLAALFMNN